MEMNAMAEKKPDPNEPKPNKFLPFIAVGLIILGAMWFVYQWNPGMKLRAETAEERKARLDEEKEEARKAKSEAKEAALHAEQEAAKAARKAAKK
jgi:F0F1-type ATP synthase membrane subunit b/b'